MTSPGINRTSSKLSILLLKMALMTRREQAAATEDAQRSRPEKGNGVLIAIYQRASLQLLVSSKVQEHALGPKSFVLLDVDFLESNDFVQENTDQ